ncbi:hypothetical protein [Actinoallomurus sp. NPDC052274]|uniref:hypothetical protein n=1 Tax=Actinoallomurus sp. NPDC052274 TaxID=3155420 RepID=UPI0034350698
MTNNATRSERSRRLDGAAVHGERGQVAENSARSADGLTASRLFRADRRAAAVRAVLKTKGLYSFTSETERDAVATTLGDTYDAAWETVAPFYVRAVHRMLGDLREEVARGALLLVLGRDAENIEKVIHWFDPRVRARCVDIRINRETIANALADRERNHGETFPELAEMFGNLAWNPPTTDESMAGASTNLTTLLRRQGLPVDDPEPPHDLIVLDNGMRGTTRAALKQMYWPHARETLVRGFYLFRAGVYGDPQPNADRGYVYDLDAEASNGGRNLDELPDDPDLKGLTFRTNTTLLLLECLTSGPWLTPDRIDANGRSVRRLARNEPLLEEGLNPARRSARFFNVRVFEGVLRIVRAAIGDCARYAALSERGGGDVQELLRPGHERMVRNARAWASDDLAAMHPVLREIAGTYCWTEYWPTIVELADAIDAAGLSAESAQGVWAAFDELRDDTARAAFVAAAVRGRFTAQGSPSAP